MTPNRPRLNSLDAFSALAMMTCLLVTATPGGAAPIRETLPGNQTNRSAAVPVPKQRSSAVAAPPVAGLPPSPTAISADATDLEHNPSLDIVERYASEHNPAIRSAFHAWQAALQRITQERSYENPMVEYMPDTQNMAETRAGPQTNGFGVSQAIPFPGKLTLRGKIADQQAEAVHENLAAVTQETLRKIWGAYAQFYFAERALEVNAESTVLARQFEAIAEAKYKVAKVPEQDVIQAQEEVSRLATQQVDFDRQRNTAIGALDTLLDRAPRAPLGRPMEMATAVLKVSLEQLVQDARAARPEIQAENHLVEARKHSMTLAKMGYLPDFSVGGQYMGIDGHMGVPKFNKDGHDVWAVTLGFSVPIWVDRVKARVDETGAQLQQEEFARRDVEDSVNDQIQDAYERLTAAARNEAIYRTTLLPQTAERIRAAQAGYQTGTVDFLTLIDSLKSYEDVRLLDYQSVRTYQAAGADLTRAVGKPIPGIVK
jgi:outer membrane protein, heavy metal efflux system